MNRGVGTSINTYRRERPTIILIRRDEYIYQPFGFMVDGGRLITGFDQSVYRELGEIGEYVEMSIESLGRQHNLQCSGLFPTDEGYTRIPTRAEVMSEIGDTVASFVVDVQNRVVGVMTEGGLYLPTEPEVYRLTEEELADRDIIEGVIRVPPQTIGFVLRELAVAKFSDFLRGAYTADTIFTNEGIATGLRLKCGGVIPISESADDEEGADAEALPSVESGWSPDINDRL